jgi:hypothetical protein
MTSAAMAAPSLTFAISHQDGTCVDRARVSSSNDRATGVNEAPAVIASDEWGDVAEVIYSVDSEFFFMAKEGTHATNQRISIGGKVVLKMKDDSYRMLSPLLEGDYHVIMTDAMTQACAKDLPVREKKSASWSKTTHLHPENNEVRRMSEAEAITDFVEWLLELKGRFSNAKHVLRGHYATTVEFPALALLALKHCDYDLQTCRRSSSGRTVNTHSLQRALA